MKRIILIILFLEAGFIYAQTDTSLKKSDSQIEEFLKIGFATVQIDSVKNFGFFDEGDAKPYYKGGAKALKKFFFKNLKYPEEAAKNHIEGEVIVQFTIGKDGTIQDVELLKKAHPLLNAEALRIMSLMPKWVPGTKEKMTLPLKFVSPKSKKTSSKTSNK